MHLREAASRALTLLAQNPPLFGRIMLAKANTLRPTPQLPAIRRIGEIRFELDASQNGSTAAMYFGSFSLLVIDAMKRYLHSGDVFIDVGANVGYLSAVGAELVGPRGQVHAFEPVPCHFRRLLRLTELNPSYSIVPNRGALGSVPGRAMIQVTCEPGQNTLVHGYKTGGQIADTIEVPVQRLDSYIASQHIPRVALIKIDAEGFELPILEGLRGHFERTSARPPIICEIAPRAYSLMGRNIAELANWMSRYGYTARDIIDGSTPVDVSSLTHVTDVLLLAGK